MFKLLGRLFAWIDRAVERAAQRRIERYLKTSPILKLARANSAMGPWNSQPVEPGTAKDEMCQTGAGRSRVDATGSTTAWRMKNAPIDGLL